MKVDAIAQVQAVPLVITLGYAQGAGLWDTQVQARGAWRVLRAPTPTNWKVKNAVKLHAKPWS